MSAIAHGTRVFSLLLATAVAGAAVSALAETRVALVIGNGQYSRSPDLQNAGNDARAMAATLGSLGSELVGDRAHVDLSRAGMTRLMGELQDRLLEETDATVLLFYSGHGVAEGNDNWLVPVDDDAIRYREDVALSAISARSLIQGLAGRRGGVNILILDACRNSPLPSRHETRGATAKGLAKLDNTPPNTVIVYAAAPGQAAYDGHGELSPFTGALIDAMQRPGERLEDVVGLTAAVVQRETAGMPEGVQQPWVEMQPLPQAFFFVPPVVGDDADDPPAPPPEPQDLAARAYEAAERVNTVRAFSQIIERFPGTLFATLAEEQIAQLEGAAAASAVADRPSPETAERALGLARGDRKRIQAALVAAGLDPGEPDGLFGQRTRAAIKRWQSLRAMAITGYLDADTAKALLALAPAAPPSVEPVPLGPSGQNWIEARNQPCMLWTDTPEAIEAMTWSGACADGMASGWGRAAWHMDDGKGVYEGNLHRGKPDGQGEYTWPNGNRYDGEWRDGKHAGSGVFTWPSGEIYDGEWRDHDFHGHGVLTWANGDRYEGEFRSGEFHGHGVKTWLNGLRYEGDWRNDIEHGRGVITWPNGDRYEGDIVDGRRTGQGVLTFPNGVRYEGAWRDDQPHGYGVRTNSDGDRFEGNWNQGCWGTKGGRWVTVNTTAEACGFE